MREAKVSVLQRWEVLLFDHEGNPLTGQAGNFVSLLSKDGVTDATAVTVAEIGTSGRYTITFTPGSTGTWVNHVYVPGYDSDREIFHVTTDGPFSLADIQAYLDANSTKLAHLQADITSTPPTAAQVRAEMDSNSTKLAHLQADITATPPDAAHYTAARGDKLDHLDADVSSRSTPAQVSAVDTDVLAVGTALATDNTGILAAIAAADADILLHAPIIRNGTAQAGAGSTITLDAGASAIDQFYANAMIVITGGTGAKQARSISAYVGATKVATVSASWVTNPDNTSTFVILPAAAVSGGGAPTANQNADAFLDRAGAIDGKTPRQALQYIAALTGGESSGDPGTPVFLGLDKSTKRVAAIVDGGGNRTSVSYDPP